MLTGPLPKFNGTRDIVAVRQRRYSRDRRPGARVMRLYLSD